MAATLAFLAGPGRLPRRLVLVIGYGAGGLVPTAILLGPWFAFVWQQTGNPIFPYANDLFHSPLFSPAFRWHYNSPPPTVMAGILFPFRVTWEGPGISDLPLRDYRIAAAWLLVPILLIVARIGRTRRLPGCMGPEDFVFIFGGLAAACWLILFSYYRFALPLEMLAPLLIALAIGRLPLRPPIRHSGTALAMVALLGSTGYASSGHVPWRDRFVDVVVPTIAHPDSTIVLLFGMPTAFVATGFPPGARLLQLAPNFAEANNPADPWHHRVQAIIDAHQGDFYAVVRSENRRLDLLASYGLAFTEEGCRQIEANLDGSLSLCSIARRQH